MVATAISHSGSTIQQSVSVRTGLALTSLTNKSLLAESLGLLEILLPLEESQGLVDEGQDIHRHGLGLLLHLHGGIEFLDGFGEVTLVKEQLSVVVIDRLLVVLLSIGEVALDEMGLGTVVVNIRVVLVLLEGLGELGLGLFRLTKLQADAGALDVTLRHRGVKLDALVEVLCSLGVVTEQSAESTSHVISKCLVLTQVTELQGLFESLSGLLVSVASLLLQSLETNLHLSLASIRVQLF
ncbi:hypothetical protein HG531_008142 [Fusarium graminearum]|nr:hypothetical protein HG531_008142 [Fusarium graminearum]